MQSHLPLQSDEIVKRTDRVQQNSVPGFLIITNQRLVFVHYRLFGLWWRRIINYRATEIENLQVQSGWFWDIITFTAVNSKPLKHAVPRGRGLGWHELIGQYQRAALTATEAQMNYLRNLGYTGSRNISRSVASDLIDTLKLQRNPSEANKRAAALKLKDKQAYDKKSRREWRKAVLEQLRDDATSYGEIARYIDSDRERLAGWMIKFTQLADCAASKTLANLLFPADVEFSDLASHLPPFDDCPVACEECDVCSLNGDEVPRGTQYATWDNCKYRKKVPQYILKSKRGWFG